MTKEFVLEKLQDILSTQIGIEKDKIQMNTTLNDDLQVDSLDRAELVMSVEEQFEIEIPEDTLMAFTSVGDVVDYVVSVK